MKNRLPVNKFPARNKPELRPETLCELCWLAGFRGVVGLAAAIGRSRVTVHRAVMRPDQFGPTYELIKRNLGL